MKDFVDIKWFEWLYKVWRCWSIMSMKHICRYWNFPRKKILKWWHNWIWYLYVFLFKNWKRYKSYTHRIVAQHFLIEVDWKKQVNHKNLNKKDNRVENLEWCDHSENQLHWRKNKKAIK